MSQPSLVGKACAVCGFGITATTPAVTCTTCGKVYHQRCWESRGGCVTANCTSQPVAAIAAGGSVSKVQPPPIPVARRHAAGSIPQKISMLAIAALILPIIGFGLLHLSFLPAIEGRIMSFGCLGTIGLILGIVALIQINHSDGFLSGRAIAIAGIVAGGFAIPYIIVLRNYLKTYVCAII